MLEEVYLHELQWEKTGIQIKKDIKSSYGWQHYNIMEYWKKGNTGRYCVKLWSYNNRSCTINRVSGKSSEIER